MTSRYRLAGVLACAAIAALVIESRWTPEPGVGFAIALALMVAAVFAMAGAE